MPNARSRLEAVFRAATYSVETLAGPRQFRIGDRLPGVQPFALLTAYNPGGAPRSPGENRAANTLLRSRIDDRGLLAETGLSHDGDHGHRELHFAVFGISPPEAIALAREFGQAAFVWFDGATADLVWVDEAGERPAP